MKDHDVRLAIFAFEFGSHRVNVVNRTHAGRRDRSAQIDEMREVPGERLSEPRHTSTVGGEASCPDLELPCNVRLPENRGGTVKHALLVPFNIHLDEGHGIEIDLMMRHP